MIQPESRPSVVTVSALRRAALVVFVCGCAGGKPETAPRTAVRLEPAESAPASPLPSLPSISSGASIVDRGDGPRLSTLSVVNQDVAVVVRELAAKFGLQYQIDPGVRGTVNATLRNKTLHEALSAVMPQGVTYELQDGIIRVGPARIMTRIFSMDYVAISRVGTASTIIQRRLGANAINGATGIGTVGVVGGIGAQNNGLGAAGFGVGADVISAVSVADAWEEVRVAVEGLVFDTPATGAPAVAPQIPGVGLGAGIGSAGRPFSRVGPDGRRLIINPMAGTVTVAAFPAQLQQIDLFLRSFESSIQRQVLIEAKIVEVNLDRSFEFGIDWNVIARSGSSTLRFSSALPSRTPADPSQRPTGNVEFTLAGGSDQITVVLNALETQGDVRVLSSPRVSALNNQRAVFDVTTGEIVFNVSQTLVANPTPGGAATPITQVTPQQVNVGIVLDVLPQIGADNTVTMNIRPVVTSVARTASFTGPDGTVFSAPVIDTRESDTMARLRAGETIIIGGLMQTRREKVRGGIPGLKDIPLLGALFTSYRDIDRKAELVIFLTPTIISGQPAAR
jgi:MSHA biogenesis protein MshL